MRKRAPTARGKFQRGGTLGRVVTILVALGLFIGAASILWAGFKTTNRLGTAASDAPDLARISCTPEGADVLTPVVRVQSDGIHVLVDGVGEATGITITSDQGSIGTGFAPNETYPVAAIVVAPIGKASVTCGLSDAADETARAADIEFVDPDGYWHDERLACLSSGGSWHQRATSWFFSDVNPVPEVLQRVVPGVLATDQLSYANYPDGEFGSNRYRIARDGQVEATFELVTYDQRSFVFSLTSCDDSGIGILGKPKMGDPATPFDIPHYVRCDPYGAACSSIFVSASWYAKARGEDASRYTYPEHPWDACLKDQPEGCPPDPGKQVLELLLSPPDADAFIADNGCGEQDDPCV